MTYHASYEHSVRPGVLRVEVATTPSGGSLVISQHGHLIFLADPTAARWLSQRLVEAAEEMEDDEA